MKLIVLKNVLMTIWHFTNQFSQPNNETIIIENSNDYLLTVDFTIHFKVLEWNSSLSILNFWICKEEMFIFIQNFDCHKYC